MRKFLLISILAAVACVAFGNVARDCDFFTSSFKPGVGNGATTWNASRPTGYGSVPGYAPPPLGFGGSVVQASAWRGRWVDITGCINLGTRPYRPEIGAFESFDAAWNGGDPNGYTFCGGNPIDGFDADGKLGKDVYQNGLPVAQFLRSGANYLDSFSSQTDSGALGAGAEFASYFMHMGAGMGTSSMFINQGMADYEAGGVDNVINRYNPLRAPFQAASGLNLMEGPGFGDQLSGLDRTVDTLNTIGLVAGAGAGVLASVERAGLSTAADEGQMLYRGVPGNETQKAILGEQGIAIPRGTALDNESLTLHVKGADVNAGVTSWTTDRSVAAQRFAGPNGTVIEVPMSQVESQIVPRPNVPKYGSEQEVLLKGIIRGKPTKP